MSRRDEPVTPVVHQIVERYANRGELIRKRNPALLQKSTRGKDRT